MGGGGGGGGAKGVVDALAPIALGLAVPGIGEAIDAGLMGTAAGVGAEGPIAETAGLIGSGGVGAGGVTATDALVGAGLGAGTAAATGKNPLTGALTGGVSGGLAPNLSDIGNAVFGPSSGTPGVTGGSGGSAGASAAPSSVGDSAVPDQSLATMAASNQGPSLTAPDVTSSIPSANTPAVPPTATPTAAPTGGQIVGASAGNPEQSFMGSVSDRVSNLFSGGPAQSVTSTIPDSNAVLADASRNYSQPSVQVEGNPLGGLQAQSTGGSDAAAAYTNQAPSSSAGIGAKAPQTSLSQDVVSGLGGDPSSTLGKLEVGAVGNLPAVAGLGYQALAGQQPVKGTNDLRSEAQALQAQAAALQNPLSTGVLPQAWQQSVSHAADEAKTAIRSRYAAMGQTGSSAEMQDLAQVDQQASSQGLQIAQQLFQAGATQSGMSNQLYSKLLDNAVQQDAQLGSALSGFGNAVSGGGQTFKLTAS